MSSLAEFKRHLRPGQVYRRSDLAQWSRSIDRHLRKLIEDGHVEKVFRGVYMTPRKTRFGLASAHPEDVVRCFLGEDDFLMVSSNDFNGLGVGTTQLYNETVVYNRKRHGKFELGGRVYDFRRRPSVPKKLTEEVLMVDLLHNHDRLAEDRDAVLPRALRRAGEMNAFRLRRAVMDFGSSRAARLLSPLLQQSRSDKPG